MKIERQDYKMKVDKSSNISKSPVEIEDAQGVEIRWLISKEDGAENFFMRVFEIEPGGFTPFHKHAREHEMFVFQGKGCVVREGKEVTVSEGHVIFIPPDEEHQVKNTSNDTLKLICLIPSQ